MTRWMNLTTNRYYNAYIGRNLFGEWSVTLNWGGVKRRGGAIKHFAFDNYNDAANKVNEIDKTRQKRGYVWKEE